MPSAPATIICLVCAQSEWMVFAVCERDMDSHVLPVGARMYWQYMRRKLHNTQFQKNTGEEKKRKTEQKKRPKKTRKKKEERKKSTRIEWKTKKIVERMKESPEERESKWERRRMKWIKKMVIGREGAAMRVNGFEHTFSFSQLAHTHSLNPPVSNANAMRMHNTPEPNHHRQLETGLKIDEIWFFIADSYDIYVENSMKLTHILYRVLDAMHHIMHWNIYIYIYDIESSEYPNRSTSISQSVVHRFSMFDRSSECAFCREPKRWTEIQCLRVLSFTVCICFALLCVFSSSSSSSFCSCCILFFFFHLFMRLLCLQFLFIPTVCFFFLCVSFISSLVVFYGRCVGKNHLYCLYHSSSKRNVEEAQNMYTHTKYERKKNHWNNKCRWLILSSFILKRAQNKGRHERERQGKKVSNYNNQRIKHI